MSCQLIVIWHPTAVAIGYCPVVHAHTAQIACKFVELTKKLDPRSGQVIEDNPQFLKKNDAAIVQLSPIKKMCMEKYKDIPELGRLAVRDMGRTVAVGVVLDFIEPTSE
jgi:elongation factor 1-alpha